MSIEEHDASGKFKAIAIVALLLVVETSAVSILKSQSSGEAVNPLIFASGIALYAVVGALFWWALRTYDNMALVNGIWQVGDIVLVTLVAVLFFRERLSGLQWFGVVLGVLAAACMLS